MYDSTNKAALLVRLFTICERQIERAQSTRLRIEELDCELVGLPILEMAKFISNDSKLALPQALSTICDDEAAKALLKSANQFWFWTLLRDSILHQGHFDSPLGFSAVRSALEAKRTYLSYQSRRGNVRKLSSVSACLLLDKGLILLKDDGEVEPNLVKNPLLSK